MPIPIQVIVAGMQATQDERQRCLADIQRHSPEVSRRHMLRRYQERMMRAKNSHLACSVGCAFCCYLRVIATPPEIFGFIDYLEKTLSTEEFVAFRARVEATAQQIDSLTRVEHFQTNIPCPALTDNRCMGYAARPLRCRNYHSLDVTSCEYMFAHPDKGDFRDMDKAMYTFGNAVLDGFELAQQDSDFDSRLYEWCSALREALRDPDSRHRYLRKEQAFLSAIVETRT